MPKFLKKLQKKLTEPSTYAGLSALALLLGVNLDPGTLSTLATTGAGIGGLLAIVLGEGGAKDGPDIPSPSIRQ